ncbi:MAG TPA: hypothetical protein VN667_02985 [Burkholderiales bacterium]|nr:hypothetical protein [Burkholderiales bacterium]
MSLLSPERILIALTPFELAYARMTGALGAGARLADKGVLALQPQPASEGGHGPWHAGVAALSALAADIAGRAARVTVVLSNHFVRYALVPPAEGLRGGAEDLAYARYCFGRIHGERSQGWEVRLSGAENDAARVASAIDLGLLQGLAGCFPSKAKPRLASVQPYLMAAFNHWRRMAGREPVWLLLAEPQRACLAHMSAGRWNAVHNARGDFDGPEQWAELLDRERHRVPGGAGTDVLVHAPHRAEIDESQVGPWQFQSLILRAPSGYSPLEDQPLAMALCAL